MDGQCGQAHPQYYGSIALRLGNSGVELNESHAIVRRIEHAELPVAAKRINIEADRLVEFTNVDDRYRCDFIGTLRWISRRQDPRG